MCSPASLISPRMRLPATSNNAPCGQAPSVSFMIDVMLSCVPLRPPAQPCCRTMITSNATKITSSIVRDSLA